MKKNYLICLYTIYGNSTICILKEQFQTQSDSIRTSLVSNHLSYKVIVQGRYIYIYIYLIWHIIIHAYRIHIYIYIYYIYLM